MLYPKNQTPKLDTALFQKPTSEYRCTPFWAWNCDLKEEELLKEIEYMKEMGMGGFHMHTRVGMSTTYLSDEYMAFIKACTEKAQKEELDNLLFISYDAARLDLVFAPDEADRIYLNFSDPWPPKGQHKRRLTHPAFLSVYQRFLKEEGEICFKTDNRPLFEHSICYLSQFGYGLFDVTFNLHATDTPNVMTEYERNFSLQGMPIYRLVARKMLPDTPMTDVRKIGQYDSKEETEEEA